MSAGPNPQMMEEISKRLFDNRARISLLLPEALSFAAFHSSFILAIRKNPKIWSCVWESLFDAAIDSAMDGLPCDGKHAALVDRSVNIGNRNAKKYVNIACYQPMAYGLRKLIIESGAATQVDTVVVYANETCRIFRGTETRIEHEIMLSGDRGDWIGVYSAAILPGGGHSVEYMTREDVMAVKESAQTTYIWDQHETEMARKTVLRRHRKSLVGNTRIVDVEERRMIAQIERSYAPKQAQTPAARPTRQSLPDHSNTMPINDFGGAAERQTVDRTDGDEGRAGQAAERNDSANTVEETGRGPEEGQGAADHINMPQSPSEFDLWAADLTFHIKASPDVETLQELRRDNAAITAAAPEDVRDEIEGLFSSVMTDLMTKES